MIKKIKSSKIDTSLIKTILKLSVPIVFANTLQSLYSLTDTFWVGRLGADAVASLTLCYPIIFIILSVGMGFTVAGSVLVSQYSGKNDRNMIDFVSSQTMSVIFFISIILSVIGYFSAGSIVHSMGAEGSVYQGAKDYLEISFLGLTFQFLYITFQNIMNGIGNVKMPVIIVMITVSLNFILDPLFIMGWGPVHAMGINGAAYSTILTQAISAIIGIYFLLSKKHGASLKLNKLKPQWEEVKIIVKLGTPASAESSTRSLSMMIMTYLVTIFGTNTTAAFGLGIRILSLIVIPALGFSQATSTLVGKSIGRSDYHETYKITRYSGVMIFIILSFFGIIFFFGAEEAIRIFVPNDEGVIQEGALFVRILSLTFGFVGIQQVINGSFRGGGSTTLAMLLAIVSMWVFRFPFAYVLSMHTNLNESGIWWAFCVSNILAAGVSIVIYRRGRWIKNLVQKDSKLEKKIIENIATTDIN